MSKELVGMMDEATRQVGTLPADRAFVLQFRQRATVQGGYVDGRIEHITSGEAALFHSLEELVTFLEHVLAARPPEP